jgi:hypothetical protein
MKKGEIEKIPPKRIEVDVKKIKKNGDHFTHREITEIKSGVDWYDFAFPVDLVNCETKVFVSVAEMNEDKTCAIGQGDPNLSVLNFAAYDGGISLIISLGNINEETRTAQINFLVFTWG